MNRDNTNKEKNNWLLSKRANERFLIKTFDC